MSASPLSPTVMLATSMHAQPGVYALLLGSGVSTGAGVLTGWGVVKELVRRVAAAAGGEEAAASAQADPEKWWAANGTGELGYSTLIETLAPTAPARQGLLAEFFEPTDEDREAGVKVPSRAHHAIAHLVKQGLVRVIITTNFDRLTEQALEAAGVSPQVIARPEAVNGMRPLAHAKATVIKLHGDYQDLGTRNTPDELAHYPQEWQTLLQQVFDEYGLVIAGWSADWDTALVGAQEATPNRRYPLYWDSRSSRGEAAQRILTNRQGRVIEASGADAMFQELLGSIEALDRLSQPPLTTAMAVERLKRYMPDPTRRIDLHDLIMQAAAEAASRITVQPLHVDRLDGKVILDIWNGYLQAAAPIAHLLVTGVWHDQDGAHTRLWVDSLQRLVDAGSSRLQSATTGLDDARLWAAHIALTAAGVAATRRGHEHALIALATQVRGRGRMGTGEPQIAAQLLHPLRMIEPEWVNLMPRWEGQRWLYPASHLLKTDIRPFFKDLIPNDDDYKATFHAYEYRLGLIQEHTQDEPAAYRALSGEYVGDWSWERGIPKAELDFRRTVGQDPDPWTDYLGTDDLDDLLTQHRDVLAQHKRR
jgi:hypothetical protein